jgi:hypothetical protein
LRELVDLRIRLMRLLGIDLEMMMLPPTSGNPALGAREWKDKQYAAIELKASIEGVLTVFIF